MITALLLVFAAIFWLCRSLISLILIFQTHGEMEHPSPGDDTLRHTGGSDVIETVAELGQKSARNWAMPEVAHFSRQSSNAFATAGTKQSVWWAASEGPCFQTGFSKRRGFRAVMEPLKFGHVSQWRHGDPGVDSKGVDKHLC